MAIESKKYYKKGSLMAVLVLFAACMCFTNSTKAQGNLLIFPKRVVFEGKKNVEKLILSNIGHDTSVYNISFIQRRMAESGKLEPVTEPDSGQQFATPYLRVFPRRVTLGPGETQIVKVQVSRTNNIDDGEYRSHLLFIPEKNIEPLGLENENIDTTEMSVKLEPIFGISIPIIIQKGTSTTAASISDLKYSNVNGNQYFLDFNINRLGNMSTYGDIYIYYVSNDNTTYEVSNANGVAVYTPGTVRKVRMELQKPEGVNFSNGKFKVVYTLNKSKEVIAEVEQDI